MPPVTVPIRSWRVAGEPGHHADMLTTPWEDSLRLYGAWLSSAGRPASTRQLRTYQLRAAARDLADDPRAVTADDLAGWLGAQRWAAETRRSHRSALRSFFGWLHMTGRADHDPAAMLPPVRAPRHRARPVPDQVWRVAVAAGDPRVHVMVMLGARVGLRRAEIARVHSRDLIADLAGTTLHVQGKGDRVRLIPLPDDLAGVLRHYSGTVGAGWLFPSPNGGHLTPAHVGKLVSRALGDGWTTHTLRHRFATSVYGATRDLLTLQELLGHSNADTTRGYVELDEEVRRRAVSAAA